MSDITVIGIPQSTCTRKVLTVLEEIEIAYKLQPVDYQNGEMKTEVYKAKNHPFGKMPAVHDGDYHIFESRAIIRYLARAYDKTGTLYPTDAKKIGKVEQWISIEQSYFNAAESLVAELVFKKMRGAEPDNSVVTKEEVRLHEALVYMDKHLSSSTYLAGEDFTIAGKNFQFQYLF